MSRMSMPFRGRTITTTVSGGSGGWLRALAVVAVIAVVVAMLRGADAAAGAGGAWAAANAFVGTVLGWTVGIVGGIAGLVFLVIVVQLLVDVIPSPRERREVAAFRAREREAERAAGLRRAARERAVEVAEQQLADEEPAGLDGTRDGVLIDAAGRFRSLGHVSPTTDDHEPVDRGRRSTGGA